MTGQPTSVCAASPKDSFGGKHAQYKITQFQILLNSSFLTVFEVFYFAFHFF